MEAETLEALKGSIQKWEKIVAGTGTDNADLNCPLCKLFINNMCGGCPVRERTDQVFCEGSPYEAWQDEHKNKGRMPKEGWKVETNVERGIAGAEVYFLKSLLPEKENA